MGHIDHGKSTLLDYIRRSNIVAGEAGGITQHLNAYEVAHTNSSGTQTITFLDTPGHEAFTALRSRGASVADVAILVVSAEDGVMPQTKEAHKSILQCNLPYVVAINKIDSPRANPDKTKQSLAEHDIVIEEWGGPVPCVAISAKTGQNVSDLLDLVLLVAEIQESKGDRDLQASGVIIESHRDGTRGIASTLLIKDGTLKLGQFVAVPGAFAPVRLMEDFAGRRIEAASFSSPVNIIGWSDIADVGSIFNTFDSKKEAETYAAETPQPVKIVEATSTEVENLTIVPLIVKVGVSGTAEAITHEVRKIETDRLKFGIISAEAGLISEADMKRAASKPGTVIVGFGTSFDPLAAALQERSPVPAKTFTIIYQLVDWLKELRDERTLKIKVEEELGVAKVLKVFNPVKNTQVLGCKITSGEMVSDAHVKIMRQDEQVAYGHIKGIQRNRADASRVESGDECGIAVDCKKDIQEGDKIVSIQIVEK
jgi:translation initiation factor IF-2